MISKILVVKVNDCPSCLPKGTYRAGNGNRRSLRLLFINFRSFFQIKEKDFSTLKLQSNDAYFGSGTNISLSEFSSLVIKSKRHYSAAHEVDTHGTSVYSITLPSSSTLPSLCLTENNLVLIKKYSEVDANGMFVLDQRANLRVRDHSKLKMDPHADFLILKDASFDVSGQSKFIVKRNSRIAVAPRIHFKSPSRSSIVIGPNMLCAIIRQLEAAYFNGREIVIASDYDSNRYRFLVCRSRRNTHSLIQALEWYLRYDLETVHELRAALLEN